MNIGNLFDKIGNIIDNKKEENRLYNELLSKSLKFDKFRDISINNSILNEGRWEEILNLCPNLNIEWAKIIDSLIPVYENYLFIIYITQRVDNSNFVIVFTQRYVWILDKDRYIVMNYTDIYKFDIIIKSLMTQVVCFNDIVIGIDISSNGFNVLENIIKDVNYRNNVILDKNKYLCGIVPIYQRLNKINSGISIDNNLNVVFHDKKINNYCYRYSDIKNYEVLEDNIVVLKKKTDEYSKSIGSVKQSCVNMSLRVTLVNDYIFSISLLESSTFNSQYNHSDSIYINNYNFAKEIIDKLDSLAPRPY